MDALSQRLILVTVCIAGVLGLAVLVYRRNPRDPRHRSYAFLSLAVVFWNSGDVWAEYVCPDHDWAVAADQDCYARNEG